MSRSLGVNRASFILNNHYFSNAIASAQYCQNAYRSTISVIDSELTLTSVLVCLLVWDPLSISLNNARLSFIRAL